MSETQEEAAPAVQEEPAPPAEPGADALDELSEKLGAFNAFRKSDQAAADAILDELDGRDGVERDIVHELSVPRPLYIPSRFNQAHELVMHSLEVLKRNGPRQTELPRHLGPLKPIALWAVQLFTRLITEKHVIRLVNNLDRLYERREAWCAPGSSEAVMLRRARSHVARVGPGYKGKALGLPSFLVGGAVLSSALGALRSAAKTVLENRLLVVLATAFVLLLILGAAWCVLRGAAVARKRIRLTTDRPMVALYQTVGAAGKPPKDEAIRFALISLVAMAVAWIVIPVGLFFLFA